MHQPPGVCAGAVAAPTGGGRFGPPRSRVRRRGCRGADTKLLTDSKGEEKELDPKFGRGRRVAALLADEFGERCGHCRPTAMSEVGRACDDETRRRLNDDEEEGEETQRRRHYEGDVTEGVGDSSLECDADLSERMGRNPAQAKYSISHQSGPKAAVSKLSKASSWHISVVNSLYGIDRRFGKHAISLGSSATAQK